MRVSFQRKIDKIVGTFICRILSVLPSKRLHLSSKISPKKIVVILLSEMGSLVLARPMFDHIRSKYVNASLFLLCFERNKEFIEILNVIPSKNIITVKDDSFPKLIGNSISAIKRMRGIGIDTVIDCELFSRISSIYSFLSGANILVGFHPYNQEGLFRGNFINRPVLYNPYRHISLQFISLVEAIESSTVPLAKSLMGSNSIKVSSFKPKKYEVERFVKKLQSHFPQVNGKKLVLLYPSGGLLPIRAWPIENFCIVVEDLIRNDYAVGIIGMENDKKLSNQIQSYSNSKYCIDLTGYTKKIRELMALFHFASLLITNDGGPGHFASMTPIPSIIFFGPETPTLYGVLDKKSVQLYNPISCSPCLTAYNHRNSPCDGDNMCLKSIDPKTVLKKSYEILKN